ISLQPLRGLLLEGLEAGGDDPPGQDSAPVQEGADGLAVILKDLAVGVDVQGEDVQVAVQEKFPVGVAAQVDAPGPVDLGQKPIQVLPGPQVGVSADGAEDELQPWFIQEQEGPGVLPLKAGQLGLGPAGHEVQQ